MKPSLLLLCGLLLLLSAVSAADQFARTLVLVDDIDVAKESHSQFLKDLKGRGHKVVLREAKDSALRIDNFGEFLFDNLVVFASQASRFGGTVTTEKLLAFSDSGHNILWAAHNTISKPLDQIAKKVGVVFEPSKSRAHDYFSNAGESTQITTSAWIANDEIVGQIDSPVVFSGIGHTLGKKASQRVQSVLTGGPQSFSAEPSEALSGEVLAGAELKLASVAQSTLNGRIAFVGSADLFSNALFDARVGTAKQLSGNRKFAAALSGWTFKERGVLRIDGPRQHFLAEDPVDVNPAVYTVNQEIVYQVNISTWNHASRSWVAFAADDVQLEFHRLDPFYRVNLEHDGKGHFSTQFKTPHHMGVFHFTLDYERLGRTKLSASDKVSVRPYQHTEFERFIGHAYPYYAGTFSIMAGFMIFSVVFLYSSK